MNSINTGGTILTDENRSIGVPPSSISADSVYTFSVICGLPQSPKNWKIKEINGS
jgi:hypothetical protein